MQAPTPPLAPPERTLTAAESLDRFMGYVAGKRLELYAAQEEAILELGDGKHVILNTPTGSGKSLVAAAFHHQELCAGRRSVYTCPIKALVNEKFLALCRDFGPDQVGMMTGDATVNGQAPILCCTAEVLSNYALRLGDHSGFAAVIMDEFHYYSDRERGVAWQVPLLTMPSTQFLLMSATIAETRFFERDLEQRTGRPCVTIRSDQRPVPLVFEYRDDKLLPDAVEHLVKAERAPVYVVHFTQKAAAENARDFVSLNLCSREERGALGERLGNFRFNSSPFGPELKRLLRHGIGLHHAGLLPKYRVLVEQLAQEGRLKAICGTDTLGVGVNVPIRSVLFTQLWKYNGTKSAILPVRDFRQIAGRAGRRGYDTTGYVVALAPEHVIENRIQELKAAGDPQKLKKIQKRKAPEGAIVWNPETYDKLQQAPAEPLHSSFRIDHGVLLNVLGREDEDGGRALMRLLRACHETPVAKRALRRRAFQLLRALLDKGILEWVPRAVRRPNGPRFRVNHELQRDFSLFETLSLWLVDTLPALDPALPDYALRVVSLAEAVLEDPDLILRKQLDRLKTEMIAEWKAEGIEYDERMERLEKLEYPKPDADFIYERFNAFAEQHPWVGRENIRPKSIVREMCERWMTFADYVREYQLHWMEGLLLRHLNGVYKTLTQTVPEAAKTEELREIEAYLAALLRHTDSSLLDEWERLRDPEYQPESNDTAAAGPARPTDLTRDPQGFLRLVRNTLFGILRELSQHRWEEALAYCENRSEEDLPTTPGTEAGPVVWTPRRLERAFEPFLAAHEGLRLDAEGRARHHTHLDEEDRHRWRLRQTIVDREESLDWFLEVEIDLHASRQEGRPVLRLLGIGQS